MNSEVRRKQNIRYILLIILYGILPRVSIYWKSAVTTFFNIRSTSVPLIVIGMLILLYLNNKGFEKVSVKSVLMAVYGLYFFINVITLFFFG